MNGTRKPSFLTLGGCRRWWWGCRWGVAVAGGGAAVWSAVAGGGAAVWSAVAGGGAAVWSGGGAAV